MSGKDFIARAAKWARKRGLDWSVVPSRGKGSHKTLYVGERRTIVATGEIPPGTLRNMLKQLGIPKEEF